MGSRLPALVLVALLGGCAAHDEPAIPSTHQVPAPHSCPVGNATCLAFLDQAAARGITHVSDALADAMLAAGTTSQYGPAMGDQLDRLGGGVAVGDYDGDGAMDLFFAERGVDRLYHNRGDGTYENATSLLGGPDGDGRAGLWFDYDNDGYPDLFVCNVRDPSRLLHNEGGVAFRDVSEKAGVGASSACQGAAAADVDGDGWLDLLVVNYYHFWENQQRNPLANDRDDPEFLYHNNGDGTFRDVAAAAGLGGDGPTLAGAFADYDEDGHMDLVLVNDFDHPAGLWRNQGDGTFARDNDRAGVHSAREGMGAVWADFDGDGHLDLYISNVFESLLGPEHRHGNMLFVNRGNGTFQDRSVASRAYDALWSWGGAAFDAENDGDLDLYVPNGYIIAGVQPQQDPIGAGRGTGQGSGKTQPDRYFQNVGDGKFHEAADRMGLALHREGRAAAALDIDGDGAMDLVTTATMMPPLLLHNGLPQGRFLEFRLQGTTCNRDAVGAEVRVVAGPRLLVAQREAGSGFESQGWPVLHFGLGNSTNADVQVRWPDGPVQVFHDVPAGRYRLAEGGPVMPV